MFSKEQRQLEWEVSVSDSKSSALEISISPTINRHITAKVPLVHPI